MSLGSIGLLLHGLHAATEASAWGECVQYAADGVPSGGSESGGGSPGAIRAVSTCITLECMFPAGSLAEDPLVFPGRDSPFLG